ncbi:hypothetical protein BGX27_008751 [Mortierella sp. AM989]|nr:hypothetical protein BGX27_008751 [Mortierella sp. AM989]
MRLPSVMLCGAPLSYSRSPKITKVEPNSFLEWLMPATGMESTHYFKLTSGQDDNTTEFTQGERYDGWGACFESTEGARRGLVAMNNALQLEIMRRREEKAAGEKNGYGEKGGDNDDRDVAQLDISDYAAVAAAAAAGAFAAKSTTASETTTVASSNFEDDATLKADEEVGELKDLISTNTVVPTEEGSPDINAIQNTTVAVAASPPAEKPVEKRTSIIGAVSSLFSSSKLMSSDRIQASSSKDDLISKVVLEEHEESGSTKLSKMNGEVDENEEEEVEEAEDPVAKQEREAKNAERIELDLGLSDMSLGDFGL